ncbi:MAG: DUF934 domain-containing protein [Deltaproteobacteria bacterium]|nr:DUF934 domain-containing protein [Deltaproteobacteria bacterium]
MATQQLGARVLPEENVEDLVPFLQHLDLVECYFPVFTDGRGYSQARLLREKFGFTGVLRAAGDVRRDQLHYLNEVGFSWFSLREGENDEHVLEGLHSFSINYRDPVTRVGKANHKPL